MHSHNYIVVFDIEIIDFATKHCRYLNKVSSNICLLLIESQFDLKADDLYATMNHSNVRHFIQTLSLKCLTPDGCIHIFLNHISIRRRIGFACKL